MDNSQSFNGHGTGEGWRRHRRDPLALKVNALLEELLWLNIRLNSRDAEELTLTEVARLFSLHGENFAMLASMLGRNGILAPKTVRRVCNAYDQALDELLGREGEEELL